MPLENVQILDERANADAAAEANDECCLTHKRNLKSEWKQIKESVTPAIEPHNAFKVLLIFDSAWWERLVPRVEFEGRPDEGRRVITDLPIRQIYYYNSQWINAHVREGEEHTGWAMIMASYSDDRYVSFWLPFLPKPGKQDHDGHLCLPEGNTLSLKQQESLKALAKKQGVPPRMIAKLRQQLAVVHNIEEKDVPMPITGLCIDWGHETNEHCAWHFWNVNHRAKEVAQRMEQPFESESLYTCGEAFSSNQGWIEGALQSTERVFKRLEISLPEWLSASSAYIDF